MNDGHPAHTNIVKLVVVGDQSSGKSSVLEGLTGIPFPRANGLCTRFATQVTFRRAQKETTTVSIIPARTADPGTKERLRDFKMDNISLQSGDDFSRVLSKVRRASLSVHHKI